MDEASLLAALVLLATVVIGLARVFAQHGRVEKLLALQLLGTTLVAVVLLLAEGLKLPGLRDIALVLGLLAAIVVVAFTRYGGLAAGGRENEP